MLFDGRVDNHKLDSYIDDALNLAISFSDGNSNDDIILVRLALTGTSDVD